MDPNKLYIANVPGDTMEAPRHSPPVAASRRAGGLTVTAARSW